MLVCSVEKSRVFPTLSDMGSMMEPPWRTRNRISGEEESFISTSEKGRGDEEKEGGGGRG